MKIQKLNLLAQIPTRNNHSDAGLDLSSTEKYLLHPHERKLFNIGLAIAIPYGNYGRIAPRSGLALKYGIDVLAGVIDSSYRGEIGVILYNTDSENGCLIDIGQKIAQLIIEKVEYLDIEIVETLDETIRGTKGYGSSDKKI